MSFLDQLGKKLSDTGQEAATKARNFAEVTRINGLISDTERRISRLYGEIGQSYYERHKDDPAAEEAERISAILSAYGEIAPYQEQIKQIKGVEQCPSCGAEVAAGSAFCNACGARIVRSAPQSAPTGGRTCPQCHAAIGSDDLFCNVCGAKLPPAGGQEG